MFNTPKIESVIASSKCNNRRANLQLTARNDRMMDGNVEGS